MPFRLQMTSCDKVTSHFTSRPLPMVARSGTTSRRCSNKSGISVKNNILLPYLFGYKTEFLETNKYGISYCPLILLINVWGPRYSILRKYIRVELQWLELAWDHKN